VNEIHTVGGALTQDGQIESRNEPYSPGYRLVATSGMLIARGNPMSRQSLSVLFGIIALFSSYSSMSAALGSMPAPAPGSETVERSAPIVVPVEDATTKTEWYGYEIFATDLSAVGLTLVGIAANSSRGSDNLAAPLLIGAVGTYVLGGPIVHVANGNVGKAFGSLGLRLGVPSGTSLLAFALTGGGTSCSGDMCGLGPAVAGAFGFGIGMLAASIIDISAMSYKKVPVSVPLIIVPSLDLQKGAAGLNLVGTW